MRSIADLRQDSRRAARKVAQEGLRPFIVEADDLADLHLTIRAGVVSTLSFPFLGSNQPTSFQQTENRYLLDLGFFPVDGTALSVQAFREPLRRLRLRGSQGRAVLRPGVRAGAHVRGGARRRNDVLAAARPSDGCPSTR